MTTLTSPQYPFDPTGLAATNRVTGELQALTGSSGDFSFLIPACTPFFGDSMTLNFKDIQGNITPMAKGIDYYLSHYFIGASRACGKPVYGSVTFLNTSLIGTVIFNPYQTLGGDWTVDVNTIATILAQQTADPRTTSWDQVAGYPDIFPPVSHEWNLVDMVGLSEMLDAMNRMIDAILTQASSAMTQHIGATGNVHHLTASQIGAVTTLQMNAAIEAALTDYTQNTDDLAEGTENKFFTEARVLATQLAGFTGTQPLAITEDDSVLTAFMKLQASVSYLTTQLNNKVNSHRPQFSGLGSQNVVTIPMTGTISFDITQAEAYRILVAGNGSVGFDISKMGDMTGQLVEFSVSTINDMTGNVYALAWPSNVKWVDGVPPPRTTAAGAKDEWYFYSDDNAVSWTGSLSNENPR